MRSKKAPKVVWGRRLGWWVRGMRRLVLLVLLVTQVMVVINSWWIKGIWKTRIMTKSCQQNQSTLKMKHYSLKLWIHTRKYFQTQRMAVHLSYNSREDLIIIQIENTNKIYKIFHKSINKKFSVYKKSNKSYKWWNRTKIIILKMIRQNRKTEIFPVISPQIA